MHTFKRKALITAVAAGLGAMAVAGSAGAVQLSQDGTGSVLIYPYYTVRTSQNGAYNTYLNVVNTTNVAKVVKVRFVEGKNSREVLDFNLWLSANDVWAGVITPTATGATENSRDESCVSTKGGVTKSIAQGFSFDFSNNGFIGSPADVNNLVNADGADTTLDRTREGYFEILEMGIIPTIAQGGNASSQALAAAVTHVNGVPANCAAVPTADLGVGGLVGAAVAAGPDGIFGTADDIQRVFPGTGGLMGGSHLINVLNGSDFGYDPVVLEDFNSTTPLFRDPGTIAPTLNNAAPISRVFYYHFAPGAAAWVTDPLASNFAGAKAGVTAVSAVLDRISVMNNYVLDVATTSHTDWVVTFPTKRHYVNPVAAPAPGAGGPFQNYPKFTAIGSCGLFTLQPFSREEQTPGVVTTEVSPPAPGASANTICWESTVLQFRQLPAAAPTAVNTLLGSTNAIGVPVPYEHGWARLSFPVSTVAGDGGYTPILSVAGALPTTSYNGLPVVGFMLQDFNNPNVTINGVKSASSYGGNFNHRYERLITGGGVTP